MHVAIRGLAARDAALSAGTIDAAVRERPLLPWLARKPRAATSPTSAATLLAGDARARGARAAGPSRWRADRRWPPAALAIGDA